MESAPLTRAHDHAREASLATNMADAAVAVSEHVLAAGEFAAAAHDTSSVEALRTLHLLERHHERLARLLQYSLEHPPAAEQQEKSQTKATSLKEKDAAAAGGAEGAAEGGQTAHSITTTAGKATATPASVSEIVSRGEFSSTSPPRRGAGADAAGQASAFLGGDGAASAVRQAAGDNSGSASAAAAAVSAAAVSAATAVSAAAAASAAATTQKAGAAAMASVLLSQQPQQQRRHPPSRELSSSIATNLASARGIRSSRYHRGQPAAPSMSTDQAPGSLDGQVPKAGGSRAQMQSVLQQQKQQKQHQHPAGASGKPSWVPPKHPQRMDAVEEDALVGQADNGSGGGSSSEGFARFYDRFGSFINRLSAPLAFAGLPLISEEADTAAADASTQKAGQPTSGAAQRHGRALSASSATAGPSRSSSAAAAEPDLSQIYSKAALRAINRDGLGGNPNDSFYVVPKTGHTASYANILSFEQKEQRRRLAASAVLVDGARDEGARDELGEGDDDYEHGFADVRKQESARPARSGLMQRLTAADPSRSRTGSSGSSHHGSNSNNANKHLVEELTTENESLKDMLDRLSRRLHAFEASAQQSHMALQESMRFMQPGSTGDGGVAASVIGEASLPAGAADGRDSVDTLAQKNRELETELARLVQRLDASERERAHQEKTLQKYRDKWEKLKAGAKARREAQGGGGESSR